MVASALISEDGLSGNVDLGTWANAGSGTGNTSRAAGDRSTGGAGGVRGFETGAFAFAVAATSGALKLAAAVGSETAYPAGSVAAVTRRLNAGLSSTRADREWSKRLPLCMAARIRFTAAVEN